MICVVVQGAVNADGLGNLLLSGLAGTIPNATYSNSLSLAEMTGVGARSVGVYIGLIFLGLAFLPKSDGAADRHSPRLWSVPMCSCCWR